MTKIRRDQIDADAFAGEFATEDHLHETVYAPADHDHDGDYAAKTHAHDYLPMGGGALTGNLAVNTTVHPSYALNVGGYSNFTYPIRWFSGDAEIAAVSGYAFVIRTYNAGDGLSERVRVTSEGYLAVGKTTDINNPLDVAGAINTDAAYKVDNSAGTAGHVLRSDGSTGAVFSAIQDGDLPSSIARDTELPVLTEAASEASGGKNGDIHRNSTTGEIFIKINGNWRQIG